MDVKGLTLRSKASRRRPKISAPQPITNHNNSAAPAPGRAPEARHHPQPSDATSDFVKRRYSAKFNTLPGIDSEAPPVPSLPSAPIDHFASEREATSAGGAQPIRVDANALRNPNLPIESYVTGLLEHASEQDIRDYQSDLRKLKSKTSSDLQQSVYQNRTQFIKISKEAEKLREEMSTLRGLMSELTTTLGQANATNGANGSQPGFDDAPTRRHAHRSSIANLESMWNIQLQQLWKNVERSQKYLPAIPGRHIVMESSQWVELDSATWKPRRPVHIVLLNDHLLIAAKKRKRVDPNTANGKSVSVPTKLVAEECWPLQDIDMIDLGSGLNSGEDMDERGVPNAVNIRYGQSSFTYRHDQRNNKVKNELVMTFRKTLEELRKSLKSEAEVAAKSREALMNNSQPASRRHSEFLDTMDPRDKLEVLIDVDGKQQNMRWVEGQLDELDIDIAIQVFETAVSRVEKLRKLAKGLKGNQTAQDAINSGVDSRANKLAEILLRALVDTNSFMNATKTNVAWLTRLGYDDRAREAYLNARSQIITKRARHCVFEGDLLLYIFQISFVYFTMIRNTIAIYQQCFPSPMSSASIKWGKDHLDDFNATLSRQLSSVEPSNPVWEKCMEIVYQHASSLSEVGVDFKDMIRVEGLVVKSPNSTPTE
ncbi:exocyst complex component exo84 [Trichophyton tonsurans CBS 112818]|uniref:Exocyst complex component EXO84 n=2 Tax=Trichophyton TaxID=5550 RepID=F2Q5K9_TRIEC|nr:exocyst complex component exo84 [Trichophyton tonsurans CBS 112818]EGE09427.1 exocyst complex component exo84 [Trichophyton equinum CBS 127.97]